MTLKCCDAKMTLITARILLIHLGYLSEEMTRIFFVHTGSTVPIVQPWLRDSSCWKNLGYTVLNLHYVVLLSGVYFRFEPFLLQNLM